MADTTAVQNLKDRVEKILKFDPAALVSRQKWGELDFREAGLDIEKAIWLAGQFKVAPLEYMPEGAAHQIRQSFDGIIVHLQAIDSFTLGSGNPTATRNQLVADLHAQCEELYTRGASWVSFLALRQGDLSRNLQQLNDAIQQAQGELSRSKDIAEGRRKELEQIIVNAREASAKVGVAVFTQDFSKAAMDAESDATAWLKATMGSLIVTFISAGLMWVYAEKGLDPGEIVQKISTKLFILALLVSATIWCGRNYKALKHQATVNRHRALSIQTFQAFSGASNDTQTKDAVLMEATRAVFGNVATGYIEGGGADGDLKVVEIARSFMPKSADDK